MRLNQRFVLPLLLVACQLFSQSPITYAVDLTDANHHELHITAEFPSLPREVLQVKMPQSSPGRYAVHNFAKNVYNVKAFDNQGRELSVYRSGPSQWDVAGHDGFVKFQYTLFGNYADGTYAGIDNRKVHLNMPAAFVFAAGMEKRPIELVFDLKNRKGWKIATQLEKLDDHTFRAPNYYYFYGSPTIVGELDTRSWQSSSNGKKYIIEMAVMHEGTGEQLDRYAGWVKMTRPEIALHKNK